MRLSEEDWRGIESASPTSLEAPERTEDEKRRLGHLWKVLTHLQSGLVQCYDVAGLPRTNNDMERTIRAIKMHYRRISGRKNWSTSLLRDGRCVAYQEWWHQQEGGRSASKLACARWLLPLFVRCGKRRANVIKNNSIAIVSAIILWSTSLLWRDGGSRRMGRDFCPHG